MTFEKGNPYRLKPKYTKEDIELIRRLVKSGRKDNEIMLVMMGERPDVSTITIQRWIKKVRSE